MKSRTLWVTCGILLVAMVLIALRFAIPAYRERAAAQTVDAMGGTAIDEYLGPEWMRKYVDQWCPQTWRRGFFNHVYEVGFVGTVLSESQADALSLQLQHLPELNSLILRGRTFRDRHVLRWRHLRQMQQLWLRETSITDEGLEALREMKRLEVLVLDSNAITDRAIDVLVELPELRHLSLDDTRVTDPGLAKLSRLKFLEYLSISQTDISDKAIDRLHAALPNVQITDD